MQGLEGEEPGRKFARIVVTGRGSKTSEKGGRDGVLEDDFRLKEWGGGGREPYWDVHVNKLLGGLIRRGGGGGRN